MQDMAQPLHSQLNLNDKQKLLLQQFKDVVKDVMQPHFDDAYLVRWLIARSWNLSKAEKMLRESLEWRKSYGADTILTDYKVPEVLAKYYPGGYYGHDKEGYPIWITNLGYLDLKGMYSSVKASEIVRYRMYAIEQLYQHIYPRLSQEFGKNIYQCNLIFDMAEMGLKNLWRPSVDTVIEIARLYEANYPETAKEIFVINAPAIFPIGYNLLKPFIHEDTKRKVRVLGKGWRSALLEHISPDQLPVAWGGTATDPDGDPHCRSKICMGGKIPEEYYKQKIVLDLGQFTTVTVSKASSLQIPVDVSTENQVLWWQFSTEHYDIGFGVYRRRPESNNPQRQRATSMEEVVPSRRINCHLIPEEGSVICQQLGTYVLRFDNTYSWLKTKKVSYLVKVLDASDPANLPVNS